MATVTVYSGFGAQKNKVSHYFQCLPIYLPWTDGTRCHDLIFYDIYKYILISLYLFYKIFYTLFPSSQFLPPHLVPIPLFCMSVSFCFAYKFVYTIFLDSINTYNTLTYVLLYDICFPLSDLLYSVWHSVGSSTSLQMTQFHFFLWLSNIPLYVCTISSLFIPCWWTFRLLPYPGCCQ